MIIGEHIESQMITRGVVGEQEDLLSSIFCSSCIGSVVDLSDWTLYIILLLLGINRCPRIRLTVIIEVYQYIYIFNSSRKRVCMYLSLFLTFFQQICYRYCSFFPTFWSKWLSFNWKNHICNIHLNYISTE